MKETKNKKLARRKPVITKSERNSKKRDITDSQQREKVQQEYRSMNHAMLLAGIMR